MHVYRYTYIYMYEISVERHTRRACVFPGTEREKDDASSYCALVETREEEINPKISSCRLLSLLAHDRGNWSRWQTRKIFYLYYVCMYMTTVNAVTPMTPRAKKRKCGLTISAFFFYQRAKMLDERTKLDRHQLLFHFSLPLIYNRKTEVEEMGEKDDQG